uniref:hypothetical protein n=1 Tax=Candidatus Stercorousia sp. TaxID=3048886 RepID=UPI0040265BFF
MVDVKIRLMSNYDIAKNLINIINQSAEYANKGKNKISAVSKQVLNSSDMFIKSSEKVKK